MILAFLRFELREQLRSPFLWLLAALYALLAAAALSSDAVQIGGGIGNVLRNAPTVIASVLAIFTLLGLLVAALFVSNALLRDFELGTPEGWSDQCGQRMRRPASVALTTLTPSVFRCFQRILGAFSPLQAQ
ncbi:hypothetical protein NY97_22115, partial [Xanthomonas citri pv. fuscans]|uniref:hypothetical protein n=5 Tax=Xanthomonas citri TaxID=346 RepID=UPI00062B736D